ncbi:hypothetical protein EVG20_g10845 [Dentipellis fragilis]|uniref:Uncharacterized protein n=1 Tax=Dentipellis fragilis TaxID=205917 RepID=A0A4Y9XRG0_9AGAM|nr:hypothetical protein EVG20_g10845 [Dentipellis fragilis]
MPLTRDAFAHLPSACRSILHAIRSGGEVDLYEGLDRILQHISNVAEDDDPEAHAYYCAPQGRVTATGTIKLRDKEQLHDADYRPSPLPEAGVAVDNDEDEDEQEDVMAPGGGLNIAELAEGEFPTNHELNDTLSDSPSALDTSMLSASTSSSVEVEYKLFRLPDFRLSHAWLRDDGEESRRYNSAVVEVKFCAETTIKSSHISYRQLINHAINKMAPQVIEAVQVAFAERSDQKEIVAIPMVNSFCCFVYFERTSVPALDPAVANQGKGFQCPFGLEGRGLYQKYARHKTELVQIISGGGFYFSGMDDKKGTRKDKAKAKANAEVKGKGKRWTVQLGKSFVTHWNNYLEWTLKKELFPNPSEGE